MLYKNNEFCENMKQVNYNFKCWILKRNEKISNCNDTKFVIIISTYLLLQLQELTTDMIMVIDINRAQIEWRCNNVCY